MNDCCVVPIDKIMANEHLSDGACCLVTETSDAPLRANCPKSGSDSKKIQRRTMEHLVKPELVGNISDSQYYYCADESCLTVYFSLDGASTFTVEDLQVAVFDKDAGGEVNVCYCFDWTRGHLKDEIRESGVSAASKEVAEKVRAGVCECDIKNPKGVCCLGDINTVIRETKAKLVLNH